MQVWPLIASAFTYSAPVAIAGVGETVSQKSGVMNIGLEGTMLSGAFFGLITTYSTHSPWLGLGASVLVGLVVMAVSGWFTICLAADQVVVGTAVNLMALGITGTMYRARFGQSGALLTIPPIPTPFGVDPVLAFLVLSVAVVWFALSRTGWGLALRAAGEYPKAVEAAGFSVRRLRYGANLIGGFYGGLAGGYLALGIARSFAENMTAGRGFVAIAMVTFGRWKPQWVYAAALLIGLAEGAQYLAQSMSWNVPFQLLLALPYLVALLVLVLVGKGTQAPDSLGVPYRREK